MKKIPAPSVSRNIITALPQCGFTLLETQAMPFDWIRLKLKHAAKPHPFELDYDGTVESLVNAVEYCADIVDGLIAQNIHTSEVAPMNEMRKDLATLAHTLTACMQS